MIKIVKKKDLDILIENTMSKAGIKSVKKTNIVTESKVKKTEVITESLEEKPLINESVQKELDNFNRLSNYTFKK
jgi:hypothetical protein